MGRDKWETGIPVVILGSGASHLFLSVQEMSSSEMPHSGRSPRNTEKVGEGLALMEKRYRI